MKFVYKKYKKYKGKRGRKLNYRQKGEVKRLIRGNMETKYKFTNSTAGFAVSAAAQIDGTFFDIAQGVADTNRVGDRLKWGSKIHLNLQMVASGDDYNTFRWMLVQWHPTSTAAPTPVMADILLNGPSAAPDVLSQYNHDNRQNYRVLWDRKYIVTGAAAANKPITSIVARYVTATISLKRARKMVQYQGGGLHATNRLFLIYMSDSAAIPHPTASVTTKVFFTDA